MRTMICLHGLTPEQEASVRQAAPDWNIVFGRTADIEEAQYGEAEIICGWNNAVDTIALAEGAKLRWVQGWSSGVDMLPLNRLEQKGVILTSASGVHSSQVTETVLAMMLGLARGIPDAVRNQQTGSWQHNPLSELRGRTVAIVGAGAIGQETARLARAFGMRVIGVRRSATPSPDIDLMVDSSGLDEALQESDYVVNILPLTNETHHLFDAERFAKMKKSAYFINVGRGETVNTQDLVDALQQGGIAGAGLDVFEEEPLPAAHPLWTLDNVIITPHTGGVSDQNKQLVVSLFLDNLAHYLAGNKASMRNVIDYAKQY